MESNHTSQDFNFQYYVDMAKQKEIAWHVFVKLIKDFSYSDISKLKYVNAILLIKLTDSYSDMERLKYLNVILMDRFKDSIEMEDNNEVSNDLNDETIEEMSSDHEIQISSVNKIETQENFDSSIHKFNDNIHIEDDVEISENEDAAHDSSNETIKDVSNNAQNAKYFVIKSSTGFRCSICSRSYRRRQDTKVHVHKKHLKQRHKCKLCGKTYETLPRLEIHFEITHSNQHKFTCTICDHTTKQKNEIHAHIKSNHSELLKKTPHPRHNKYFCPYCPQNLNRIDNYQKHLLRKHLSKEIPPKPQKQQNF